MKEQKGFTLIELLIVILIIGVLAGIALPKYRMASLKAKYATLKRAVSDIEKAYILYYNANNKTYPTKFDQLDFPIKTENSSDIEMGNYSCSMSTNQYHEIWCMGYNMRYIVSVYGNDSRARICVADNPNTSSLENRICQQETGRNKNQGVPHGTIYYYRY